MLVHFFELHLVVIGGTGGGSNGKEEPLAVGILIRVCRECSTGLLQKENHVIGLGFICWILPVNIETIETNVRQDLNGTAGELGSALCTSSRLCKMGRVCPSAD